jgi:hypothetical protein
MKNRNILLACLTLLLGFSFSAAWGSGGAIHPVTTPSNSLAYEPVPVNRQRYLGITIFNFENDPRVDGERIEHSAAAGCNAVEITISWDRIYPTRQSVANWKVVDSHVQTALRLGLKIALRIHVGREIKDLGGFWETNQTMQAADGSRSTGFGITQFSYAHQPTVELAKNFVKETTQRYLYLQQQNKLLFFSVVASPALESEYSPVLDKADGTKVVIAYDYSDPMKVAFRQWLQGKFSLLDLNKRWNTGFGDWNAVSPPSSTSSNPHGLFSANRRGLDWYVFRHQLLERFLNDITNTIKSVDGSIRVVNQHGAVWDRLSGLRGTYAFKSLNQNADGLKFNDGPTYNHRFSMDVVRSNLKPGAFMINAVDGMFWQTASLGTYYDQVKECFDHGASMLTLANFGGQEARIVLTQLVSRVVNAGLLNPPVTQVQTGGSISYKLSEILRDTYSPISMRWTDQYNRSGKKPVQVTLIEDVLDEMDGSTQPDVNQAPEVITAYTDRGATVGQPFSMAVSESHFIDPDGTIAKVEVSGLSAGLSYNASTNLIVGTPTSVATLNVTVKATDNDGATGTDGFVIRVSSATQPAPAPAPEPETEVPVTGSFDGYLDKVECGTIRGWAWDRNKPDAPVTIEFSADGKVIGTTVADIYRLDLKEAGKGNGSHAYSFPTPTSLKDGRARQISAKVRNSTYTLKYAPKSLTCSSSARASVESAEGELSVTVLGNPVGEQTNVEVRGVEGKTVRFQLTDVRGRIISDRSVETAEVVEKQQFNLGRELTGLLLLRVVSGQQAVTVKLLKP